MHAVVVILTGGSQTLKSLCGKTPCPRTGDVSPQRSHRDGHLKAGKPHEKRVQE